MYLKTFLESGLPHFPDSLTQVENVWVQNVGCCLDAAMSAYPCTKLTIHENILVTIHGPYISTFDLS